VIWNMEVKFPAWAVTVYSPLLPARLCGQPNFNIQASTIISAWVKKPQHETDFSSLCNTKVVILEASGLLHRAWLP